MIGNRYELKQNEKELLEIEKKFSRIFKNPICKM